MRIEFHSVVSKNGLQDLSLELDVKGVLLLIDPSENLSRAILNAIVGLDEIYTGEILIDSTPLEDYLNRGQQIRHFGYVFDEGIMLSNLSLKENLMLPLRWIKPNLDEEESDALIDSWIRTFGMNFDLDQRPVMYHAGELKMLSFIRTLLIAPKLLLIDDPYYMLNKPERESLFRILKQIRASYPMLIASLDDDFAEGFADTIIDLSSYQNKYQRN
jgi:ABC-type lipoprotein export system ATPase subunit